MRFLQKIAIIFIILFAISVYSSSQASAVLTKKSLVDVNRDGVINQLDQDIVITYLYSDNPTGIAALTDINQDNEISFLDLTTIGGNYGFYVSTCQIADINNDFTVNTGDLSILRSNLNQTDTTDNMPSDLNGDGSIDTYDEAILNSVFNCYWYSAVLDSHSSYFVTNKPTFTGIASIVDGGTNGTIADVSYSLDNGDWTTSGVSAQDGFFNRYTEAFTIIIPDTLNDGNHNLKVRATTSSDTNSAISDNNFTVDLSSPIIKWNNDKGQTLKFEVQNVSGAVPVSGIGVSLDNLLTTDELPTFSFQKGSDVTAGIDKYQVILSKAGDTGYADKVYIDGIPNDKPDSSQTQGVRDMLEKYISYDNDSISVRSKRNEDKLTSGAYKWKVRAVDRAGNQTDTDTKILRVNFHEANFSKIWFPFILLTPYINSTTNTITKYSPVLSFYGITTTNTKVKLTIAKDDKFFLSRETTANPESRWGINITKEDKLISGTYIVSLSAINTNGDYTEIPSFILKISSY